MPWGWEGRLKAEAEGGEAARGGERHVSQGELESYGASRPGVGSGGAGQGVRPEARTAGGGED